MIFFKFLKNNHINTPNFYKIFCDFNDDIVKDKGLPISPEVTYNKDWTEINSDLKSNKL